MPDAFDYHNLVNYDQSDPAKVLAQKEGLSTIKNLPTGFSEVDGTRGESAYVFQMGTSYGALVQEGLGTKSLIASEVYEKTGQTHFAAIAQDTVACVINDLVSVGATPIVLNAYWSASSYDWLTDEALTTDFITGWRTACDTARVVWGGGETQSLQGVVVPEALEFAGSAFGMIQDEKNVIKGMRLEAGDAIVMLASSGVHANGISLIRQLAATLPDGYSTKLASGATFGEAVLTPTYLYAKTIMDLQAANLPVHYLSNITGHGWRKVMRAVPIFTYRITVVPPVPEVFAFVADHTKTSETEMYGTFNMGAGFAVYLPSASAEQVISIAKSNGIAAWLAGSVETGDKQVIIEPKHITYSADSLEVR